MAKRVVASLVVVMGATLFAGAAIFAPLGIRGPGASRTKEPRAWDARTAASYLDRRLISWTQSGAMDHGTFCISCHTGLPFAMGRSTLHGALGEAELSPAEHRLLDSVTTRVRLWGTVQPYLGDKGSGKSTESVFNALVLASEDAPRGKLRDVTKDALRIMWEEQSASGSWRWINAGNEPWEAPDSDYWGATLAAVAAGTAPEGYLAQPSIQDGLGRLKAYLARVSSGKSLFNQLALLWASTRVPGLVTAPQRAATVSAALAAQRPDGGWSTATLIPASWRRHDGTPQAGQSDGYATGLVAFILRQAGVPRGGAPMRKAKAWLSANQDPSTGAWPTASPNATRDPATDVGKFMTDAATAYSVLALSSLE